MLLRRTRSQLLVVDVQERLLPAMHEGERMVDRCAVLMRAALRLAIPITMSEQYRKGLGATVGALAAIRGDAAVFEKVHFSCAADGPLVAQVDRLVKDNRMELVICGIEAHVCVLQSALGFKDMGLHVAVVADAVTSRRPESATLALARLRAADVSIVNTEMVLFEWLHQAGTAEFKELSALIK